MKTLVLRAVLVTAVLVALVTSTARAQSNSVLWHTIAGGGGTSTGTVFAVRGTIGQSLVGSMTNTGRGLISGFWSVSLNTNLPPTITTQPQSLTLGAGQKASFTIIAAGTPPLGYQWRFNGFNLPDATATNYTRKNIQSTDAGDYTVVVTNSRGSVTSAVAVLSITSAPPTIIFLSRDRTNTAGDKVSFFVRAAGSEPLSYQWRFNGIDAAAQTNDTYRLNPVGHLNAGGYSVMVTNAVGAVTSSVANLTIVGTIADTQGRWLFNSTSPDSNVYSGVNLPAVGGGVLTVLGIGITNGFRFGNSSDPASPSLDNSGLQTGEYSSLEPNKTAGVQCQQSTLGCSNIVVAWKQRVSTSGSKYWRFQYTTNGSTYTDADVITMTGGRTYRFHQVNLNAVTAVNNNSNFAFRIVAEYQATATGGVTNNYVGTTRDFGSNGTAWFDLITVFAASGGPTDSDHNGLPDAWEQQYFGALGVDPNADADGDGASHLREFLAGTNPTNAASALRFVNIVRVDNAIRVDWTTVGGHSYVVQRLTNSSGSLFTNFLDLSPIITADGPGEGTTNYLHIGGATNPAGYYRVRLGP